MISRRSPTRFAVSIVAGSLLAGGAGFAISACSSSTTDGGGGTEAGSDVAADTSRTKVDASPAPEVDAGTTQTPEQCVAACNAAHPSSTAKETAIDTCWMANCQGPCVDNPPTGFDAGEAGIPDAGPDANPVCGTGVTSQTPDCDNCTQANCCPSWQGCFNNQDCTDLDQCIGKCFP